MENLYTKDCIRTFTGKYVNVFDPTPEMICLEDIAHSLSQQCRFGGHLPRFYSVAEHSILCSLICTKENQFQALMHDASESYLLDIPSPIKKGLANYHQIEEKLMMVIAKKFGFNWPMHDDVKDTDKHMLEREWNCIMLSGANDPLFRYYSQDKAKAEFIERFHFITRTQHFFQKGPIGDANAYC